MKSSRLMLALILSLSQLSSARAEGFFAGEGEMLIEQPRQKISVSEFHAEDGFEYTANVSFKNNDKGTLVCAVGTKAISDMMYDTVIAQYGAYLPQVGFVSRENNFRMDYKDVTFVSNEGNSYNCTAIYAYRLFKIDVMPFTVIKPVSYTVLLAQDGDHFEVILK